MDLWLSFVNTRYTVLTTGHIETAGWKKTTESKAISLSGFERGSLIEKWVVKNICQVSYRKESELKERKLAFITFSFFLPKTASTLPNPLPGTFKGAMNFREHPLHSPSFVAMSSSRKSSGMLFFGCEVSCAEKDLEIIDRAEAPLLFDREVMRLGRLPIFEIMPLIMLVFSKCFVLVFSFTNLSLYTKSSKESQFSSLYRSYCRTSVYFVHC